MSIEAVETNNKKQILFVDDDLNFLTGLFRSLRQMTSQWEMQTANSVDDALVYAREHPVDVIITDFRMDGRDGLDLLAAVTGSEDINHLPVVMLTGSDESDLKRRALALGAADLLGKPVIREDLIARIQSVLRLKESQDALRSINQTLEIRVQQRTAELEQSRMEMIWRLARAGEFRDEVTGNHVYRVAHYSRLISQTLLLGEEFVRRIYLTSPLHDIGKIGIPDAILGKKGRLDLEERRIMEHHCHIGARILSSSELHPGSINVYAGSRDSGSHGENALIEMASTIALRHHEKWDGNGYPNGLAGEDIPLEARIVAVADVYDALSTARPYKPAFAQETVMSIMTESSGSHFCPYVFQAMLDSLNEINRIRLELQDDHVDLEQEEVA